MIKYHCRGLKSDNEWRDLMMLKKLFPVLLLTAMLILFSNTADASRYRTERDERDFRGASYNGIVVNCEEWISLRSAPSADANVIAKLPLGTVVIVYDGPSYGINGFYPVEYEGMKGYCLKDYLEYYSGGGGPVRN